MKSAVKISPVNMEERKQIGIRAGDTVRVSQKVPDKDGKFRIQAFEGLVIAVKHGHEAGGTFTVRATPSGVGVEKVFPLYSPMIDTIEIVRRSKVRRAKLYFIRDKAAKEQKRAMRRQLSVAGQDAPELAETEVEPKEATAAEATEATSE